VRQAISQTIAIFNGAVIILKSLVINHESKCWVNFLLAAPINSGFPSLVHLDAKMDHK
jgi:hypothetical protein